MNAAFRCASEQAFRRWKSAPIAGKALKGLYCRTWNPCAEGIRATVPDVLRHRECLTIGGFGHKRFGCLDARVAFALHEFREVSAD